MASPYLAREWLECHRLNERHSTKTKASVCIVKEFTRPNAGDEI